MSFLAAAIPGGRDGIRTRGHRHRNQTAAERQLKDAYRTE